MKSVEMFCPGSIEEVLNYITHIKGSVAFLSGGTDFIINLKKNHDSCDFIIDLSQVSDLNYIQEEEDWIKIGAATSFADIAASPLIRQKARCLAQAADQVGSVQIRNRATIGGNVASASPAGDSLPVLLVLEAMVTMIGPGGKRSLPIDQVITGSGITCLEEGEFISEISFPVLEDSFLNGFEKIGSRTAVTIARLSIAAVIKYNQEQNMIEQFKLAAGALGQKAFLIREVADFMKGKKVDWSLACQFSQKMQDVVDQAIPGRYSQNYKRHAVQGLADNLMQNLFGDKVAFKGVKHRN